MPTKLSFGIHVFYIQVVSHPKFSGDFLVILHINTNAKFTRKVRHSQYNHIDMLKMMYSFESPQESLLTSRFV
jgi:hypothetical protein